MAFKTVCTSLLLATGSLANFSDLQSEIPDGLSPACSAAATALQESQFWFNAEFQTEGMFSFMCQSDLVRQFVGEKPIVRRCTAGTEFITVEAREQYAIIAETAVVQHVIRNSDNAEQYAAVYFWDGIPRECTTEDYQLYEDMILSIVTESVEAVYPSPDYTVDVQAFLFANDQGLPGNFGAGYQTSMTVEGNSPLEDSVWTVACDACATPWSVDIDAPGTQGFAPDLAIIVALELNADETFAAECQAIYAQLEGNTNSYGEGGDNLNIFCPDDADITIQVNGGTVQAITSFTYDAETLSNPTTMIGGRVAFDSQSTTDFARTDSASTAAASLLVAVLALVSSVSLTF